jgi:xylose isomerase
MEPSKHQYDFDSETVIGFLRAHGLDKDFKLNIEVNHATLAGHTFEHELAVAVDNGMLGSIDANRGDAQNGWDTDQFPIDNFELTQAMMQVIRNGGLGNGGSNFDAKLRRNSTDPEDIFIAHISGMDAMARARENAAAILDESPLPQMLKDRYASFDSGEGKAFEEGKLSLEDLVAYAKKNGEPKQTSGKQELYETIVVSTPSKHISPVAPLTTDWGGARERGGQSLILSHYSRHDRRAWSICVFQQTTSCPTNYQTNSSMIRKIFTGFCSPCP